MESEVNYSKPYKVPFNILICDISNNSNNNSTLISLVLGQDYYKLNTKQLIRNEISYIHKEWKWLFTPTTFDQISTKLKYYSEGNKDFWKKNTMLLFKTESVRNNSNVDYLLTQIEELLPNNQPMTVFITNEAKESIDIIGDLIKDRRIDKLSFYLINNPNDDAKLLKMIYIKFYIICSYYNQLGDQYIFSQDMDEVSQAQVCNQRFNIIIVGRPGCGKSTFINALLGEKRCLVGDGMPVSTTIIQYHHSKYPISFYDTPGFDTDVDIKNAMNTIDKLNTKFKNQVKKINLILYLINNGSKRTLLTKDEKFLSLFNSWRKKHLSQTTPLLFLLTKSGTKKEGNYMKSILDKDLKQNCSYLSYDGIFPIEMSDIYHSTQSFGIVELMDWLYNHFNKYKMQDYKQLYANAKTEKEIYALNKQTHFLCDMTDKEIILKSCRSIANGIVASGSLIAGGAGFIPLPFDFPIILAT